MTEKNADFYEKVYLVCCQIPEGKVATYGQIALLCGQPSHARQVGYGLNRKLEGRGVPAHRVVNCRGFLSGAASFEMPGLQKMLLEQEGVTVSPEQQVDLKRYGWKNTMEDALYLQRLFRERGLSGETENSGD